MLRIHVLIEGSHVSDDLPRQPPMIAPEPDAARPTEIGIAAAALVETVDGPRPAGALRPGALLRTVDGGLRVLRRITVLPPAAASGIVTVAAGAVADGQPARSLGLCRGQPVVIGDGVWPAGFLEDGAAVTAGPAALPCVLLETDAPSVFLVEGLACASEKPPGQPVPDASLARLRAAIFIRAGGACGLLDGTVEALGEDGAKGWVRDRTKPDVPVLLALLCDGVPVAHGFADLPRPDLAMAGIGPCAFHIGAVLPVCGSHVLELRRAEDGASVSGGMFLLRPSPGDPDVPAPPGAVAAALVALTRARLRRAPSAPR